MWHPLIGPHGALTLGHVAPYHLANSNTQQPMKPQHIMLYNTATCQAQIGPPVCYTSQSSWHHYTICPFNPTHWLFSCLPKISERNKFHIHCQIEAIQASLESKWQDLQFGSSFGRFPLDNSRSMIENPQTLRWTQHSHSSRGGNQGFRSLDLVNDSWNSHEQE